MGLEYGREDIVYSNLKRRIEYCYYVEDVRHSFGSTYEILDDLTLKISLSDTVFTLWKYEKKDSNLFEVYREFNGLKQIGIVKSLMPLEFVGGLKTINKYNGIVIWETTFKNEYLQNSYQRNSKIIYPELNLKGKIIRDIDLGIDLVSCNLDTVKTIALEYDGGCYNDPLTAIRSLIIVIDTNGRVASVEQFEGGLE